jgi:hypothetical protein
MEEYLRCGMKCFPIVWNLIKSFTRSDIKNMFKEKIKNKLKKMIFMKRNHLLKLISIKRASYKNIRTCMRKKGFCCCSKSLRYNYWEGLKRNGKILKRQTILKRFSPI